MNPSVAARIGPNAIIRVAAALGDRHGAEVAARVFETAGLAAYLREAPGSMVDEAEVTRLQHALRAVLGDVAAAAVSREAGRLTAEYLLAHRIPRPVQWLLRILPPRAASRVLLAAISRHAWTFAGSGRFGIVHGDVLLLSITGCAICRGAHGDVALCDYYTATFESLFRALVARGASVTEVACEGAGAPCCRFEVRW